MRKAAIIIQCIFCLFLCSCTANEEPKSLDFSDFKTSAMINDIKYSTSSSSPIKLNKVPMPDFGTYNIRCLSEAEYSPQVPGLDYIAESEGTIMCYTFYENIAYFVVSYDIYHEFSHIIKFFSFNPETQILSEIYKYEDVDNSVYVSNIYVGEDGIFFLSLKNDNRKLYYIEQLNNNKELNVVYSSDSILSIINQSEHLAWYEGENDIYSIKALNNGNVISLMNTAYFFRATELYIHDNTYYYINKDESDNIYADVHSHNSLMRINNLPDNSSFKYADDNELIWTSWKSISDYTNPCLNYANLDEHCIWSVPTVNLGVHFSDACINGKVFVHLIRDRLLDEGNDFFENVYYIDFQNQTAYNLTENEIGSNTSLIRVEYDRLRTQNNYLFFFSRYNSSEVNADYKYEFLYWCDLS